MILENLKQYNIILASKSPRRAQLLSEMGLKFSIGDNKGVAEIFPDDLSNKKVAIYLAELKTSAYNEELKNDNNLIITADTIVCLEGKILGKPKDRQNAVKMLQKLSGKKHKVITGVCIKTNSKTVSFSASTKVFFNTLSKEEINYYINNYKPYDKAGAYGIQEWIGMAAIEKIEGSYFNVVGLPIHKLYKHLAEF